MSDGNFDPFVDKASDKPKKSMKIIGIAVGAAIIVAILAVLGFQGSLYNYAGPVEAPKGAQIQASTGSSIYTFITPMVTAADLDRTAGKEPTRDQFQIFDMMHQEPYVNTDYGFQMNYPSAAYANENRAIEGMTFIVSFEGGTVDEGKYSINVMTQSMDGMKLTDYVSAAKTQLAASLATNNYNLLDSRPAKIRSDYEAYTLTYLVKGESGTAKVQQVIIPHNGQVFVITFMGVPSLAYDVNLGTFNAAVGSFKFL